MRNFLNTRETLDSVHTGVGPSALCTADCRHILLLGKPAVNLVECVKPIEEVVIIPRTINREIYCSL
jgi:hypothetical protein